MLICKTYNLMKIYEESTMFTTSNHFPKDQNIQALVKGELAKNSLLQEENIQVELAEDSIVLRGDVDSLDKMWLAEDIASDVTGGGHIRNEINVFQENQDGFYET